MGRVAMMYVPTPRMRRARRGASAPDVCVRTQHQMPATHATTLGVHARLSAPSSKLQRGRVLEYARAGRLSRAGKSLGVLERVQMAAARIDQAAEVALALHVRGSSSRSRNRAEGSRTRGAAPRTQSRSSSSCRGLVATCTWLADSRTRCRARG